MVEICWLILFCPGLFLYHSWYLIHYLVSIEIPPTQSHFLVTTKVSIQHFLRAFTKSLLWEAMDWSLTLQVHPEPSSIMALSTGHLSYSVTKYCVNFICLSLITVIRLGSVHQMWSAQDHKYYQQHVSWGSSEDQNHSDQKSLFWKYSDIYIVPSSNIELNRQTSKPSQLQP